MRVAELFRMLKESGVGSITLVFNENAPTSGQPKVFVSEVLSSETVTTADEVVPVPVVREEPVEVPAKAPARVSEPIEVPKVEKAAPPVEKVADGKSVFDQFVDATAYDDGTPEFAQKRSALIGRMSRDDLLRVNVEFSCGIDTDQTDADLRKAVQEMF